MQGFPFGALVFPMPCKGKDIQDGMTYTQREWAKLLKAKRENYLGVRTEAGLEPLRPKVRECLKCGTEFESWHANNRICDRCKMNRENNPTYDL